MTKPDGPELFTVEASHNKLRLTQPRLTDLGTVETEDERLRDRAPGGLFARGNKAAVGRTAKRALTAPLRAARARLQDLADGAPAPVSDALLSDAMAVFNSARVELGSSSVFVLSNAVSFATESVLANYYAKLAAEVGFDTEAGRDHLETAQRCEQCAQRAMTACIAAVKALPKRARNEIDPHEAAAIAFGSPVTSNNKDSK